MGICTSDPLTYLIKQYGEDVCKYIVAIKSNQFIDQKAPTIKQRIQQQFKTTAGNLDKEFDSKEATIKNNFQSVIGQVKQSNPAALQAAKTSQNKTQQQLLGFDSFQQKINNLKSTKDGKIKQQQKNLLKVLDDKKVELQKQINDNKPSLPLFDQMPICLRQKVLSEGEQKFAPQIKSKQEQVLGVFEKFTNMNNLQQTIKNAVGLGEIDKMTKDSSATFEKAKKIITMVSGGKMGKSCFG